MNYYRHSEAPAVWESWRWLLKDKLESVNRISRLIHKDLINTGMRKSEVMKFMEEQISALCEEVAEEQEAKGRGKA